MVNKVYPPGQVTPYASTLLRERVHPMITYTSHDDAIEWNLHGPMAPYPGVQEGAYLVDGIAGLYPTFTNVEHKGARQDGVTTQRVVYDPAEMDLQVEFTAAPNHNNPEEAAADIRRVIRDWMESWDPRNPGTLSYTTPDAGRWWCKPRLFKAPPDRQFKAQARRQRQRYTWTIRNDDCFWRSNASLSVFDSGHTNSVITTFPDAVPGGIGSEWEQIYTGPGSGTQQVVNGQAVWVTGGSDAKSVTAVLQGQNSVHIISVFDGVATGGTFTLTYDPEGVALQTAPIAFDASPQDVQAALEALASVGAGNVSVTAKYNGGPYRVEFINARGLQFIPLLGVDSNLTGSSPSMTVDQNGQPGVNGAGGQVGGSGTGVMVGSPGAGQPGANGGTAGQLVNAVTVSTGELPDPRSGAPGASGAVTDPSIDIYGWFTEDRQSGVRATVSNGNAWLYQIIDGVAHLINAVVGVIGLIANAVFTLVTEIVQVAVGIVRQIVYLIAEGIRIIAGFIGAIIGAFFAVIGFGQNAAASPNGQIPPPPVTGVGAGTVVTTASGQLTLTNVGTEEGWPDFLCYGPGIFRIANGPGGSFIEFGPLVAGQIALLRTLPNKRGVVDLTPNIATTAPTPQFDDFVNRLLSLATNGNVGGLLVWFQSLFGIKPPQGNMYSLLKGRFTVPIPPKPVGALASPVFLQAQIANGDPSSRIIAALTPLRRWPE